MHGGRVADVKIAAEDVSVDHREAVCSEGTRRDFRMVGGFKKWRILVDVIKDVREDGNEIRKDIDDESVGVVLAST